MDTLHDKNNRHWDKKEIPIVILLDNNSASMSEISTLMLKSQGKHVTVVGGYSAGATAGLGDSDQFNGGIRGKVSDYFRVFICLYSQCRMQPIL